MKRQRGVSLSGLMMGIALLIPVALLGMKVTPSVIEYYKILKAVKSVGNDSSLQGAGVAAVRKAFEKHAEIDNFKTITAQDIEVTKDGGQLVVFFAYQDKIPLFANVSLVMDYEGSSQK
jgi:Tfp pilus assembly protein FimT